MSPCIFIHLHAGVYSVFKMDRGLSWSALSLEVVGSDVDVRWCSLPEILHSVRLFFVVSRLLRGLSITSSDDNQSILPFAVVLCADTFHDANGSQRLIRAFFTLLNLYSFHRTIFMPLEHAHRFVIAIVLAKYSIWWVDSVTSALIYERFFVHAIASKLLLSGSLNFSGLAR